MLFFQGSSVSKELAFDVGVEDVEPGIGLPDRKPIDIFGFYTGMKGDAVLARIKAMPIAPDESPFIGMAQLQYARDTYLAVANVRTEDKDSRGKLVVLLSSNASGNQLVGIYRDLHFRKGREAGTAGYLGAIEEKYGKSSVTEERGSETELLYGYRDGEKLRADTKADLCNLSLGSAMSALSSGATGRSSGRVFQEVRNNAKHENRCSAMIRIILHHPPTNTGRFNPNSVKSVQISFIDADRAFLAYQRDVAAQKELQERALDAPLPEGTGKPKL
ncbi:hypothetical protein GGD81_004767 [Rhodobium orientis]|uniref:Uncharacterized protein n=1 Tax=Rhodobium orientis TaxID=34017 RepID=A0A327JER5_9HYPH|nr:hypothetical protein [Rhodobium orientis]MBB4305685.1 hypothetical protein [Rhodobium orientis]MBK5948421.1 hypothetical protein [Rhodobium orientis]RAI24605.1 hypothetical protein CH339_21935 [Rhodobium orientis]